MNRDDNQTKDLHLLIAQYNTYKYYVNILIIIVLSSQIDTDGSLSYPFFTFYNPNKPLQVDILTSKTQNNNRIVWK